MNVDLKFGRRAAVSGKTRQMVVLLHGYGADGADLLGLADPLGPHLPDAVFYAPDAPDACSGNPFGRQWFGIPRFDGSTVEEAMAGLNRSSVAVNAFLEARLAEEGLQPKDLILLGFSQGAMTALHIAPRRAVPIAGVVAISGRLIAPERLIPETTAKPPILLMHGDRDDVVDFKEMALAGDALVAAGFDTYGHVMKRSGHGIAPDGLQVALAFMKEQLGV